MAKQNFTIKEASLLKKADAIIELCQAQNGSLSRVPAFEDKLQLLRDKRSQASTQSVVKHQATTNKAAVVNDAVAEKEALIVFMNDSLGLFKEYAKAENDVNLTNHLAGLRLTSLKRLKPMDLVITLNSFAETVKKMKADRLLYQGLEANWLSNLTEKVAHYESILPKKETFKSNTPAETTNFKAIMTDIQGTIESMNNLVSGYKKDNLDFHTNYTRILLARKSTTKNRNKNAKTKKPELDAAPPIVTKDVATA